MLKEELKAARKRLRMTQLEFANVLGVTAVTVGRYEQGLSALPKWMSLVVKQLGADPRIHIYVPLEGECRITSNEEMMPRHDTISQNIKGAPITVWLEYEQFDPRTLPPTQNPDPYNPGRLGEIDPNAPLLTYDEAEARQAPTAAYRPTEFPEGVVESLWANLPEKTE